jgi:hypothetical protein
MPAQPHDHDREGGAADAFTVPEFCSRHRISPAFFYKLRSQGQGPEVMRVGARILISKEAAAAWRAARTAVHQQQS